MAIASLIFGILSLVGACLALLPIVQVFNYCVNLPAAVFGTLLAIAHLLRNRQNPEDRHRVVAIAGLVINLVALILAVGRMIFSLAFGGGVL